MYYRIGDKVKILEKKKGKPDVWGGMTGRVVYIMKPDKFSSYGFYGYGIRLDEVDSFGSTKLLLSTRYPFKEHPRITKTDSSKLNPKFLDYRSFKFSQVWK